MIKEMQELLKSSENLLIHIEDNLLFKNNRDQFIETLNLLILERKVFIEAYYRVIYDLNYCLTDEEKIIRKELVDLDQKIIKLMNLRMKEHQSEWLQVNKKVKYVKKYINPYRMPTSYGAFYDKRN